MAKNYLQIYHRKKFRKQILYWTKPILFTFDLGKKCENCPSAPKIGKKWNWSDQKDIVFMFPIFGLKGVFLMFFGFFSKSKNCSGIRTGTFGGVREKKKIDWTTFSTFSWSVKILLKCSKIAENCVFENVFWPLPKVKIQKGYILNLHSLSFLTMVLNVAVAVEMMEKLGV